VTLVYGPADHGRTTDFLHEIEGVVISTSFLMVIEGDFNLIRGREDKNNGNINWARVHQFNDFIVALSLRELNRARARFTWTNKQCNPVRCVLDRAFITPT
jgi:hypothetical protein